MAELLVGVPEGVAELLPGLLVGCKKDSFNTKEFTKLKEPLRVHLYVSHSLIPLSFI